MLTVYDALQPWLNQMDAVVVTAMAIFLRISAIVFFLPGFGEQFVTARVKLAAALAFAAVTWPLVLPTAPRLDPTFASFGYAFLAEATCGLLIGFGVRMMIFALQMAGTMASQSLSLSQMFGGVTPDPQPVLGSFLLMGGLALAFSLGLHIKAATLIVESYSTLPFGQFPLAGDVGSWSSRRAAEAFSLAISLALPFLLVAFIYNLTLGFINRAMPQLMVAFVGMPFITWTGMLLFSMTAGAALTIWHEHLDAVLFAPLGLRP